MQQYGGFYKHQVESSLSGAEKMFHAMGYMSTGQETMVLGGPMTNGGGQIPVDQDRVTTVARDCLLAYVECQVIICTVRLSSEISGVRDFGQDIGWMNL